MWVAGVAEGGEKGSRAIQAAWLGLGLAILVSALAVGSIHTATLCVVTAILAVTLTLAWWSSEPTRMRPAATLLLLAGMGLTAYTAIQCVPLPIAWLGVLAPRNADVWSRALAPLHERGPAWAPISVDPSATQVEALKGIAYLLAFVTALRITRTKEGVRWVSNVILATGVTLAVAALLHPAFGAKALFGIYEPGPGIEQRHLAPLMNPNNLAGYLNVALCIALAGVFAPSERIFMIARAAVVVFLGATQLWIASRGGVICMVLGAAIVAAVVGIGRVRRRHSAISLSVVTGAVGALGIALVVLGSSERAAKEIFDTDTSKLRLFSSALRMIPAMPVFGCGRGSFESAFPAFRSDDAGYVTFSHPENVVVQWLVEWGVPFGLAGMATVGWALRPTAVLARSTTAAGAWAALLVLMIQNFADLGTEIPGLMLSAVICAAIVVGGTPGHEARSRVELWAHAPRRIAVGGLVAACVAVAMATATLGRTLHDDQRELHRMALRTDASVGELHSVARSAMMRHPAEPYLPFAIAVHAARARNESVIPWVGATFERASVYGPAHLVLARAIASTSQSQARLEYRLAVEQMPEWVAVVREASRLVGTFDDAMELVPSGKLGVTVLELLSEEIGDRLPATAVRLDSESAARMATSVGPASRATRAVLDDLDAGDAAPWCEGEKRAVCISLALASATTVEGLSPRTSEGYVEHARAVAAAGDPGSALKELAGACAMVEDRITCLQEEVRLAISASDEAYVEKGVVGIVNNGCSDNAKCAADLEWVAEIEYERGNRQKALAFYRQALERAPDNDNLLEHVAAVASQIGLHAEAARAYDRLSQRYPADPRWKEAAAQERATALKDTVRL